MGRCPVRSVFTEALAVLEQKQDLLKYVIDHERVRRKRTSSTNLRSRFMFDQVMPLSEALGGYDIFEKMKAQKVVFVP